MFTNLFNEGVDGSIDIGSRSIRGLTISNGNISKLHKRSIRKDDGIEEVVNEFQGDAIREVIDELSLKKKKISLSLPGQYFSIKKLSIKKIEDGVKRKEEIEEELLESLPGYEPVDYITDTVTLRKNSEVEELLAISIEREKIEYYQDLFTEKGVKLSTIHPDFISLYNLIEKKRDYDIDQNLKGVIGVIDIGLEGTKIIFLDEEGLLGVESIYVGGDSFTSIIQNYKGITYLEAEEQKKTMEIGEKQEEESKDMLMFTELTTIYNDLDEEIDNKIEKFTYKHSNRILEKIILLGGGSRLNGLLHKINEKERIDTEFIDYSEFKLGLDDIQLEEVEIATLIGNVIGEVV